MKIAHISDVHVRFGSRHEEYRVVFDKLYKDLKKIKPDRIVITGDLNHYKINMSPGSLDLSSELLINLSNIAPCDIIAGNHDMNMQQLDQGDTLSPIIKIANLIEKTKKVKSAYIIDEDNKNTIDYNQKAIYYYEYSGFYNVGDDIVYGVYSCKDGDLLNLTKKEKGKKYIALYHGQIHGARGNNGYELLGDNILKVSTFNNFDIGMLGDIHEHQFFGKNDSIAYAGSLIQQDYGETIDKGYLLWDLDDDSFAMRFIPNEYGFAKITVSKGEILEDRIDQIKFSNNRKKTKVHIIWEDYEENYSVEKESQIKTLVKSKFGCEVVKVEFEAIAKDVFDVTGKKQEEKERSFIELFTEYIDSGDFDCDGDLRSEIILFAEEAEKILEIKEGENTFSKWELNSIEICNLFSFGENPFKFNFDKYVGLTGVFGKNYCGKTNFSKAIVWGLYQEIVGGGKSDAKKLVNLYTKSDEAYVKIYLTIDGEKYRIYRKIKTTKKKNGDINVSYVKIFEKEIIDSEGEKKWTKEISDKKATEKIEVETLIQSAIGTFEDFTKVSLQTQGGKDDYLSLKQQPKNDLINKYLGLEPYRSRYDYGNEFFKDVKRKQKNLGNIEEIEEQIKGFKEIIRENKKILKERNGELQKSQDKKQGCDDKVLELTKELQTVEYVETDDVDAIKGFISSLSQKLMTEESQLFDTEDWLNKNFIKNLPFDENETPEMVANNLTREGEIFSREKNQFKEVEKWLKENLRSTLPIIEGVKEEVVKLEEDLRNYKDQLPLYKGEKCPTCGTITSEPDAALEAKCLQDIDTASGFINAKKALLDQHTTIESNNRNVEIQENNKKGLMSSLEARQAVIVGLKKKAKDMQKVGETMAHNEEVKRKTVFANDLRNSILNTKQRTKEFEEMTVIANKNKKAIKENSKTQDKIDKLKEESKSHQLSIFNINKIITDINGDIRVEENNLNNFSEKLKDIRDAERTYKKYSIYLQAVHRDGIPMLIIRRKIPVVTNKINRILSDLVEFKFEFIVQPNGDVTEQFYYMQDKMDALPLSFASGAQKFAMSIAIQDGLNYVTRLTKPSIKIIDEGFGALDDELTSEITNTLNYLKNRYKNVLVMTHRDIIKDYVERSLEFSKTKKGIPDEIVDKMSDDGGISQITFY